MAKVRIDALPSLAETLGMEGTWEEPIPEAEAGCSVRELLTRLSARYHRLDQIVMDMNAQELTGQVVIFLNGRNINLVNGLESRLSDGDVVTLIPYVEGG